MNLKDLTYGELASTRETLRSLPINDMTFDQEQAFFNALSIIDAVIGLHLDGKLDSLEES